MERTTLTLDEIITGAKPIVVVSHKKRDHNYAERLRKLSTLHDELMSLGFKTQANKLTGEIRQINIVTWR